MFVEHGSLDYLVVADHAYVADERHSTAALASD
jgi:hypothetical protein